MRKCMFFESLRKNYVSCKISLVLLINVAACSVMVYHVEMGSTMDMDSELDLLTAETSRW